MARIEFHILSHVGNEARTRLACQLIEQLYQQQKSVFVQVDSESAALHLDDLLWTFKDQAFIPHEICTPDSPSAPVIKILIGTDRSPTHVQPTLINLTEHMPAQMEGVTQLIEIVDAEPAHKQAARERYKQYRELGHQLETINH